MKEQNSSNAGLILGFKYCTFTLSDSIKKLYVVHPDRLASEDGEVRGKPREEEEGEGEERVHFRRVMRVKLSGAGTKGKKGEELKDFAFSSSSSPSFFLLLVNNPCWEKSLRGGGRKEGRRGRGSVGEKRKGREGGDFFLSLFLRQMAQKGSSQSLHLIMDKS